MAGNVCQSKSGTSRIHQRRKRHGSQPKTSLGFHRVSHSSMLICSCCFRFSRLYLAIYNLRQRPQICPWMCLETPKLSGSRSFVSWIPGHKFSVFCVSCCFKRLTSRNSNTTTTTQDVVLFRIQSCWKIMNSNCPLVNPVIGWKIHQKRCLSGKNISRFEFLETIWKCWIPDFQPAMFLCRVCWKVGNSFNGHSVIHVPFATTLEAKGVEESEGVVGFWNLYKFNTVYII